MAIIIITSTVINTAITAAPITSAPTAVTHAAVIAVRRAMPTGAIIAIAAEHWRPDAVSGGAAW